MLAEASRDRRRLPEAPDAEARSLAPQVSTGQGHGSSRVVWAAFCAPAPPQVRIEQICSPVVPDSADELAYVPAMEAAGYVLRIREADWYEHHVFTGPDTDMNLHVFSPGCPEIARMLMFRDLLRTHEADRARYEAIKRDLAGRTWRYVQDYADAKAAVVESILIAAGAPGPGHPPEA